MSESDNKCRWCRQPITLYLNSWWGPDDDCACPQWPGREHEPFKVTVLPPTPVWNTLPQLDVRGSEGRRAVCNRETKKNRAGPEVK